MAHGSRRRSRARLLPDGAATPARASALAGGGVAAGVGLDPGGGDRCRVRPIVVRAITFRTAHADADGSASDPLVRTAALRRRRHGSRNPVAVRQSRARPGGHLLVGSALLYFAGVLVVSVNPVGRARSPLGSKGAGIQDRSAQSVDVAPKTPGGAARTIGLGFEDLGLLRSGGPTTSVEDTPQRSATGAGNGHGGPHEPTD